MDKFLEQIGNFDVIKPVENSVLEQSADSKKLGLKESIDNFRERIFMFFKEKKAVFGKLNNVAYSVEALIRQGMEFQKSESLDAKEALKKVNEVRKKFFGLLKSKKKSILEICEEGVYSENSNSDSRDFIVNNLFKNLINNLDDVLDETSLANLTEVRESIEQGDRVAFIANHLSETDPVIFDLLLRENNYEDIAEKMNVLIGGVVRSDPFKDYLAEALNRSYVFSENNLNSPSNQKYKNEMTSFNEKSVKTMRNKLKNHEISSIFVHPSGKRCRPNIDNNGEYIEKSWDGDKVFRLFRMLGITKVVPVSIFGTENIHGPKSNKSGDDDCYVSNANVYYRVGSPISFSDFDKVSNDNDLRKTLEPEVNKLIKSERLMYEVGKFRKQKQMFFKKKH